jgi:hypothetical protein
MESWKIIEGFENYSVSDFGNVKNNKTEKILKQKYRRDGYMDICLVKDKNKSSHSMQRLVAKVFIPNLDAKPCVDHIDNNRHNNHIDNLRWVSKSENQHNRSINKNSTSMVKGVDFHNNKWRAQIRIDGIRIHIGHFTSLEDAKQARITRANQAFGIYTNACEKII